MHADAPASPPPSSRTPHCLELLVVAARADLAALYLPAAHGGRLLLAAHHGSPAPAPPAELSLDEPPPLPTSFVLPLAAEGETLGALLLARAGHEPFDAAARAAAALAAEREVAALLAARLAAADAARERLMGQIIERIPSSLVVVDRSLRVVLANRNFLLKSRRHTSATIGRPVAELFPAALARYTHLEQKVREVFRSGHASPGDRLTFSAPGLPARTYFYQLLPLGAPPVEQALLLMDDITERERLGEEVRRAERHLAEVVACAGDLVVSLDLAGHIRTWNPAAERISGLLAASVIGAPLTALCAADQRPALTALISRIAAGESLPPTEADLLVAARPPVPIAWAGAAMRGDDAVTGVVLVGRDLTERRRLELQQIQADKSLSLGIMAGGIAHEIRNPLGIITAAAQLIADHPCQEPIHTQAAERATRAARRAATIVDDLLTFARPDRDSPQPVDLNALVEDTLALLLPQPDLAHIAVRSALAPLLPAAPGSPGLLRQVLTNLVLNACRSMPTGGELMIATAHDGAELSLSVRDTGHGIPPALIPRIFDPFFTTAPIGRGTGLGLAISHSIVREHGGRIEVASQVGVGSTFIVRLPLGGAA